jgi:stress response protein YsnF/sporulation protein YlmC with PRC-barrel domain
MNNQTSAIKVESATHNLRIKLLLDKLRTKVKNFSVMDTDGILLGEVKDVKLDSDRQLNLVVAKADNYSGSGLILLRSKHIQQVDSVTKSLFVDISKLEIDRLSEYRPQRSGEVESSERVLDSTAATPAIIDQNASVAARQDGKQIASATTKSTNVVATASSLPQESESDSLARTDTEVVEQEVIRLLEERLIVDRGKRKIGDVIVRKEIETRMVQVPVRYEKLIVEKVGPERERLAEIELGSGEVAGIDLTEAAASQEEATKVSGDDLQVSGEFKSPKSASLFLNAVALQRHHGCVKVRVELVLENAELQKTYQEWFNRCAGS